MKIGLGLFGLATGLGAALSTLAASPWLERMSCAANSARPSWR
ncbi:MULTISPECIES: hypothetical protein [unclassified Mesorhizobium]|nr:MULTISPECIES: hypothetical protein [unclassified Mesorhizobium]